MELTRAEKIQAIREVPELLAAAVAGISESELDSSYRDGGWTVRQIVHHIADSHSHAYIRVMFMLAEEHPTIKPYDENVWAVLKQYPREIRASVSIVAGLHERMAALFENLSEADWLRGAYHPERGELTIEDMLTIYCDHGRHHIAQIQKARELAQ